MTVKDLIVTPVTTCSITTNVGEARDLMTVKKFSALPVVEIEGEKVTLKGIVSYFDLSGVYDDRINIQQVMTSNAEVISINATVREAAQLMVRKKIHHLVAMEEDEIAGIVSSFDFVKVVAQQEGS